MLAVVLPSAHSMAILHSINESNTGRSALCRPHLSCAVCLMLPDATSKRVHARAQRCYRMVVVYMLLEPPAIAADSKRNKCKYCREAIESQN